MSLSKQRDPAPGSGSYASDVLRGVITGAKGALTAYTARSVLFFLLKITSVLRGKVSLLAALQKSFLNTECVRFGAFVGGFAGIYRAALGVVRRARGEQAKSNAAIAGSVAGLAILALDPDTRVTLAQYMVVRCVLHLRTRQ